MAERLSITNIITNPYNGSLNQKDPGKSAAYRQSRRGCLFIYH